MARRRKSKKIAEAMTFSNVFQGNAATPETWSAFFGNDRAITLELGCGTGAYTTGLAALYPKRNFIGVDIKGARIWRGAKTAQEEMLGNAAFLRTAIETLDAYFTPGSIEEIWIPFPDPYPRKKQWKHRLVSPRFFEIYKKLLMRGGQIHLKTDDDGLILYAKETAAKIGAVIERDIVHVDLQRDNNPARTIETAYEKRHRAIGKQIHYLSIVFDVNTDEKND